ncbi:NfeD family protein [Acidilobus sp.]|uniref:NfeD family protein n=1 Tax=Acidilobus sp. TaxID=1872109 RepID=UPI003D0373AE
MKIKLLLWLLGVALVLAAINAAQLWHAEAASAPTSNATVVVVNFNVPVDLGSSTMMQRAVTTAELLKAKAIVIVMNTPGGYLSDMLKIVSYIEQAQDAGIPVYTYVPPDGMAASAGSYIAMAANSIIMANGTFIGPSTPIVVGGTPLEQNHTEDAMIVFMESLASKWGRNATAAKIMVVDDRAFTAEEALRYHLINNISNSLSQAMSEWGLASATQVQISENAYEQFLSVLSNSTVDGILITLGFMAILIDLFHPTFIVSAVGVTAIIMGLVGAEIIGASAIGLTLLLLGAIIMFLELKMSHGFAMIAGAITSAAGIYLLAMGIPYVATSVPTASKYVLTDSVVAIVGVVLGLYIRWIASPMKRKRVMAGPESLIGDVGVVVSDLAPVGEVRVQGIVWRAVSASGEAIKVGEKVKVVKVEGVTLFVERATGEGRGS